MSVIALRFVQWQVTVMRNGAHPVTTLSKIQILGLVYFLSTAWSCSLNANLSVVQRGGEFFRTFQRAEGDPGSMPAPMYATGLVDELRCTYARYDVPPDIEREIVTSAKKFANFNEFSEITKIRKNS